MTGVLEEKSLKFAIRIVNLYKYLVNEKRETVMSKQVLSAGTSIGANIAEAQYEVSRCYKNGLGVEANQKLSQMWRKRAIENGYEE